MTSGSPYQTYKYRLKRQNRTVAAFNTARDLPLAAQRSATPDLAPGPSPLILEQGISLNPDFEQWAKAIADYENLAREGISLTQLRQDFTLEVRSEDGQAVMLFNIYGCWVSELETVDNPGARRGSLAIKSLTLENEGLEIANY